MELEREFVGEKRGQRKMVPNKMVLHKKGDASMWWIIIGAVIALVVLIILMVIFTSKTSKLEGGLSDCQGKGGVCMDIQQSCPKNTLKSTAFDCSNNANCCIGAPKSYDQQQCPQDYVTDVNGKQWCR